MYEIARIVAGFATAIGVAIAAWQIWRTAEQSKTTFEDALSKEYRELIRAVPYKALIGQELTDDEILGCKDAIFNYLDFCNQQIYLRSKKRIRCDTWMEWQDGMKVNMTLPLFSEVAAEVFSQLPDVFEGLRRVMQEGFKSDPAQWY
ncbi:hypothetical protein [Thioalkalivibrio sulfidiphilus]|uniref:hypothetical protein n=1 Tax=Thioalkalivibrio sulfidiphilus TaxID=1033854 RepID=UPI0009D66A85|nr:hypothetical protein [Thioalkalivibrio sulfidiphilus]